MGSAHWFVLCEAGGCGRSTELDSYILVQDTESRNQYAESHSFVFVVLKDKVLANKAKQNKTKPQHNNKKTLLFYNSAWPGTLH